MTLHAHVTGTTVDTVSSLPALYFDGTAAANVWEPGVFGWV